MKLAVASENNTEFQLSNFVRARASKVGRVWHFILCAPGTWSRRAGGLLTAESQWVGFA